MAGNDHSDPAESQTTYRAVLFDFGGVLTTSLLKAFRTFGAELGNETLPLRLLGKDYDAGKVLAAHEEGRASAAEFEQAYAETLQQHGVQVSAEGLIARIKSTLQRDPETIALVARLRDRGVPVGLLSNSFGDDGYAGYDLEAMFDAVTISRDIGIRKPSRQAYRAACEKLGVPPGETVMVDDLQHNLDSAARLGMGAVLHREAATTHAELERFLDLRISG